ncbi:hypothetical protein [Croceibacterium aestuarii]|uniref:hypothetical protein n=1 Tax=Croceibacterium aestuarii TaxID=3064139 RepID=UPI00272E25C5|nr:hypothetical protein [Croceibacterium sp. D39]
MPALLEMSPATTRSLRIGGWSLAALLLALPAVAMQFTSEVDWTFGDFAVAGLMLAALGGVLELAARGSANLAYRAGAAIAALTAFLALWIIMAVGIVGAPDDPLNLVYIAVLGIAACAAITAGRDPARLARAMLATAGAQALVLLVHLVDAVSPALVIDSFFVLTWSASGALFARAARQLSGEAS